MKRVIETLAIGVAALSAGTASAVSIVAVTPQGEVEQVRQVTVKFSEAVVAFGDPRLADPLAVACEGSAPAGSGRWANDRVWLYEFREPLGPGTICTATVRSDWKPAPKPGATGAGASAASAPAVTGVTRFAFSTGGPAVVAVQPGGGGEIEEDQHFLLRLNGPAVEASVLAHAWCEVEGIGERLALRIVGGEVRAQILKARGIVAAHAERTLVARCERPLPNGAAMRLVWGKGISSASNPKVVSTVEQRFRYTVRAAFTAEFTCERERANAPCLPIRPMSVRFSAPVARELAGQPRLRRRASRSLRCSTRTGEQGVAPRRPAARRRPATALGALAGTPPARASRRVGPDAAARELRGARRRGHGPRRAAALVANSQRRTNSLSIAASITSPHRL